MESEAHDPRRRGMLNVQGKRLTEYAPWALAHEASSVLSSEQAVTCPLFLKIPTIEDVAQGGIGDCAYLATVMAILSLDEGPLIVHHMMRDLPPFGPSTDPCVVVRLFDFNKQPYYLKLPRTIITSWLPKSIAPQFHANVLPKSGAWPIFLEKALTAFDDEGCFAPGAATYTRINGATGDRSFKLLLGVDAKREEIPRQPAEWVVSDPDSPLQKLIFLLSGALDPVKEQALVATIFPNPLRMYAIWQTWLRLHPGFLAELLSHVESRAGETVKVPGSSLFSGTITVNAGKVFNAQHLSAFITSYHARDIVPYHPLEFPGVVAAIAGYALRVQALPGKRASGAYAKYQIDFFNRLREKYLAQIPIVVATDGRYIGTSTRNEKGHSGGEAKVKGLASRHAYAVLGVFEVGGRRIVRLGNPWGDYGRAYLWQVLQNTATPSFAGGERLQARLLEAGGDISNVPPSMAIEIEEGVFDLDLYDLTKRFRWVSYCTEPPTLSRYLG
jgi:hypothetical protein